MFHAGTLVLRTLFSFCKYYYNCLRLRRNYNSFSNFKGHHLGSSHCVNLDPGMGPSSDTRIPSSACHTKATPSNSTHLQSRKSDCRNVNEWPSPAFQQASLCCSKVHVIWYNLPIPSYPVVPVPQWASTSLPKAATLFGQVRNVLLHHFNTKSLTHNVRLTLLSLHHCALLQASIPSRQMRIYLPEDLHIQS